MTILPQRHSEPQTGSTSSPADRALERKIRREWLRLINATDRRARLAHWQSMVQLISRRSPHQVAQMERARGLRP
jgi:hypothetical protein